MMNDREQWETKLSFDLPDDFANRKDSAIRPPGERCDIVNGSSQRDIEFQLILGGGGSAPVNFVAVACAIDIEPVP